MVSQPHEGHTKATQKPRKSNLRVLERKFANCKFLVLVGEKNIQKRSVMGNLSSTETKELSKLLDASNYQLSINRKIH